MWWLYRNRLKLLLATLLCFGVLFLVRGKIVSNPASVSAVFYAATDSESEFPFWGEKSILSPDKKSTVFLEINPEVNVALRYGSDGHVPYDEIWIKDSVSGDSRLLVKTGDISDYSFAESDAFPFSDIWGLQDIAFSLDGSKLYFMSYAWTTSRAIFSVDVATCKLRFISGGNSFDLITEGVYKGSLKVLIHKYRDVPEGLSAYDHYYVISEDGRELEDLGD